MRISNLLAAFLVCDFMYSEEMSITQQEAFLMLVAEV